jgi:hypothetical protein
MKFAVALTGAKKKLGIHAQHERQAAQLTIAATFQPFCISS